MSSTEGKRTRELVAELIDEVIVPLAKSRRDAGEQPYFRLAGEEGMSTYYEEPLLRKMQAKDFEFPGGGTAGGLIDALAIYWTAQGEIELAAMAPKLKDIAQAARDEAAQSDGSVNIFCYTMF
jgi:hypothetical protein